jgi:hypothetical protein
VHQRTVLAVHGVLAWARVLACLLALMPCARREDCYITCLKRESASVGSSKPHSTIAPCDAEDLVDARMIMGKVVDSVTPRVSPAVTDEQLFKHRRGVERLRQLNRALVDDKRPPRMIGNDSVIPKSVCLRLAVA